MILPIDVIPNSNPPRFKWQQVVTSPNGKQSVPHEGSLGTTAEMAVVSLLDLTKQLLRENASLQGLNEGLAERIAQQSELLSKRAEKPQQQIQPPKNKR